MAECKAAGKNSGFFFAWFTNLILDLSGALGSFFEIPPSHFPFRRTPSRARQILLGKLSGSSQPLHYSQKFLARLKANLVTNFSFPPWLSLPPPLVEEVGESQKISNIYFWGSGCYSLISGWEDCKSLRSCSRRSSSLMSANTSFRKATGTRTVFVLPDAHLWGLPPTPCFFFLECFILTCLLIFFVCVVKTAFL